MKMHEKTDVSVNSGDILAKARTALANLADHDRMAPQLAEGEALVELIAVLKLPAEISAAVLVFPLHRDNFLPKKFIDSNNLQDLSQHIIGLDQLHQFSLPDNWQPGEALAVQQSEALRKMLLAVVADVRLVLVRIAQQLHQLRTARTASTEQQRSVALETREIYAPLANRLGVWQLKWEMEDLAFRYLDSKTYASIAKSLNEKRVEREQFIETVKSILNDELTANGVSAEISGRPKHIYSIWRKMQRKERGLDALFDIRAVRILVADVNACYAALGVVHNMWSYIPGEFDDYIANPKENDYQSLHTAVIGPEQQTVEIQIRSREMHRHAELGVAAHWRYKEGAPAPKAFDQKIGFLRQLLEPTDTGSPDLLEQIRDDFFEDRVYAVSPKGDVVELAAKATPLDFAYHVHTQVGHRCRGAKVNGRIVPLTYTVSNGDQIEIITGSQPNPSRDWLSPKLGYLASARSRAKVRNWFRHQDRDQHLKQGKDVLDRELARLNVKDVSVDAIAKQLKQKDSDALFIALGSGDLTSASVATALHHLREPERKDELKRRRQRTQPSKQKKGSRVTGVGDLLSTFARCCRPVPPEAIAGYITKGRGVSIHRADCGNFLSINQRHPERVLHTTWSDDDSASYPVELSLHAFDRNGLIRDITGVLADENASVIDLKTSQDAKEMQVVMQLSIEIRDLPTLSTAINRLEQIPNVVSVRRKA